MSLTIKDMTEPFIEKDIINSLPRLLTQAASQFSRPMISSSKICFVSEHQAKELEVIPRKNHVW
jgi:hypothetical protein